ncbi:hypothetical protein JWG41_17960, partial [Leptospira sp. 201903075]|uniref:hypothetical protein n=1 Tax=Leptospira chreensis TaxID=2810035 RepID=UPI001962CE27
QCKRGDEQGYIDNALRERNSWCSIFLLQISDVSTTRTSGIEKLTLTQCLLAQEFLNKCENQTTLRLGNDDIK